MNSTLTGPNLEESRMSASHRTEITDEMIAARLGEVAGCSVEWTGHMPPDAESWDDLAESARAAVGVAEVRAALEHDLVGDDAVDEIDMAISMACEPDGLPDNACVGLQFAKRV